MGEFENGSGVKGGYHIFDCPQVGLLGRTDGNAWEILELLFTDVETRGERLGYKKAVNKYEKIFQTVESEYHWTKKVLEAYISDEDSCLKILNVWLEMLKTEEEELKEQIGKMEREFSEKCHVSIGDLKALFSDRTGSVDGSYQADVLGMMYCCYKVKKFREAKRRGYTRAKELYVRKIDGMKEELEKLQEKGDGEIRELVRQMRELLDKIWDERIRVAELKNLCSEK